MAENDRDEKIRLGGMALLNGVLVHGPSSWACAVRTPSGEVKVASDYKRLRANRVRSPLLRGPARLAEAFAVIPAMRKRLPEARLPFQRGGVLGAMVVTAIAVRGVKSSRSLTPFARELIGGLLSAAPAGLPVPPRSSRPSRHQPRSSAGWSGTPRAVWPKRSPVPDTSFSTASRR